MFLIKILIRSLYHGAFIFLITSISVSQIIFFATLWFDYTRPPSIHMLDVGQGDSFFVEAETQNRILVDAGPPKGNVANTIKNFLSYFDSRIDVVIISHFDSDHVGQLKDVIEKYKPQLVVVPAYDFTKSKLHDEYVIKNFLENKSLQFIQLFEGDGITFGNDILRIVYPRMLDVVEVKNDNETSLVFKFQQSNNPNALRKTKCDYQSVLFTGDIGVQTENKIISRGINIESSILKVGHHGSRYSSTKDFIAAVDADVALISYAKKNNYGHPNKNIIDVIQSAGTKIYLSGELGNVTLPLCK